MLSDYKSDRTGNYSANHIKECPIGQKSNKSIQICQTFMIFVC